MNSQLPKTELVLSNGVNNETFEVTESAVITSLPRAANKKNQLVAYLCSSVHRIMEYDGAEFTETEVHKKIELP